MGKINIILREVKKENEITKVWWEFIDGHLKISEQDFSKVVKNNFEENIGEYFYNFTYENTKRFIELLTDNKTTFENAFVSKFGGTEDYRAIQEFCDTYGIKYTFLLAKLSEEGELLFKVILEDGSVYEGEINNGKIEGYGKITYLDGDEYEGEWQDGYRHGRGIILFSDGGKYDGEWRNGYQHGKGTMLFSDGGKYEGEWQDGYQHGRGTMLFSYGDKYEGEWRNGGEVLIVEEALKFIESEEMREYLRERGLDNYPGAGALYIWCEIVYCARAPIEEKAVALRKIALKYGNEARILEVSKLAEAIDNAFAERYLVSDNTMFSLLGYHTNYNYYIDYFSISIDNVIDDFFIQIDNIEDFDTAVKLIRNGQYDPEKWNFFISKAEIDKEGVLESHSFSWNLNANGNILFFNSNLDDFENKEFLWKLSVPFSAGDIVTIDCRPEREIYHVVIADDEGGTDYIGIGDNGVIYVNSLCKTLYKTLCKMHGLSRTYWERNETPALLYATRFDGELQEHEKPLKIISEAIKAAKAAKVKPKFPRIYPPY